MAEYYEMSPDNVPIAQSIQLANRGGKIYGALNHVTDVVRSYEAMNPWEVSFKVHKYADAYSDIPEERDVANYWNDIKDFRLIYLPREKKWFEINVTLDDSSADVIKSITATHLEEAELSQLMLYDVEINTIDKDMIRDDYQVTTFYNAENPKASLLNRILADKAPHYVIHHVDESLCNVQRSFSFDNCSILDALKDIAEEVQCLFVYGEASTNGHLVRSISAYDLLPHCMDCGERGEDLLESHDCKVTDSPVVHDGYGHDTTVFVSVDNLAESISYEADVSSYKTCFRLEAGDDLMTATVANCNPNGSNYVWYFSDAIRADMSDELRAKLEEYDTLYDETNSTTEMSDLNQYITSYNNLVTKYFGNQEEQSESDFTVPYAPNPVVGYTSLMDLYYNAIDFYSYLNATMMPAADAVEETTAEEQAALLTNTTMSPIGIASTTYATQTTIETAIKNYAKVYIDTSIYSIGVVTDEIDGTTWTGHMTITSLLDEEETADTDDLTIIFNDDAATFVKQKMDKALAKLDESEHIGIVELFSKELNDFKDALKRYCLTRLASFYEMCEDCLDVMVEAGFANGDTTYDGVYVNMYTPYLEKQKAIIAEIAVRDGELASLQKPTENTLNTYYTSYSVQPTSDDGIIDVIEKTRQSLNDTLDMKSFLGDDLWIELSSYRRDDTYSNSNFKSYDNMNSSELIKQAQDFYSVATKEIKKAGTLQHKITAELRNLFVMPEFEPIRDRFDLMNWIRLAVDGEVYRLRLTKIEVEDDDYERAEVEFSDVMYSGDSVSDIKNLLGNIRSMSTSYSEVARQAEKGDSARSIMNDWFEHGLNLTNQRIVGSADNQNIVYGSTGILLRKRDDLTGEYDNEQLKIINKGLYYTDDGWETAKVGVGEFYYVDPETGIDTRAYGINGEAIVGKILLGSTLKLSNADNSLYFDNNGLRVFNNKNVVYINPNAANNKIFKITKKKTSGGVTTEEDILYTTSSGDAVFKGNVYAGDGEFNGTIYCKDGELGGLTAKNNKLYTLMRSGYQSVWIDGDTGSIYTGSVELDEDTGEYVCGDKGIEISSGLLTFYGSAGNTTFTNGVIAGLPSFSISSENTKIFGISNGHNSLFQAIDGDFTDPYILLPKLRCSNLTESRAIYTDANGNLVSSNVTDTELGRLSGVTSSVQTQIDSKIGNTGEEIKTNLANYVGYSMSGNFGILRYAGVDDEGNQISGTPEAQSGLALACSWGNTYKMIVAFSRSGKIFMRMRGADGWGNWTQVV